MAHEPGGNTARVGGAASANRERMGQEIREAMKAEPELLKLADALREKFGAKLCYLKTSTVEFGHPVVGAVRAI